MAKALLGQHVRGDDRLVWEAARLRQRVQDLQLVVRTLQEANDHLRAELETRKLTDQMALELPRSLDDSLDVSLDPQSLRELIEADRVH